jgi:spoIIIJ-associated protein
LEFHVFEPATIEAIGANVEEAIARGLDALNVARNQVMIEVLDPGLQKPAAGQRPREARVRLTINDKPAPPVATPAPAAAPRSAAAPGHATASRPAPAPRAFESESLPSVAKVVVNSDEDVMNLAQQTLQAILDRLQVKGQVMARVAEAEDEKDQEDGPTFVLDIRGDDLGILIGRRGETLSSLQYLTRLIVSSQIARNVNLVVDVEGYKARREKQLRLLAQRMAERVASTRKPIALEPMPANERRIVHLTLRDHPVVTTESVGRDEERKVTIILKSRRRS